LPFLDAQKVYPVKEQTTAEVKINASSTIFPANTNAQQKSDWNSINLHFILDFSPGNLMGEKKMLTICVGTAYTNCEAQ